MSKNNVFEVERVVKKRYVNGQPQYFLKWLGYASNRNTWEPEENLNCPILVENFERNRRCDILGVKREGRVTKYLIKFGDARYPEEMLSDNAIQYYANQIIEYYENRLEWTNSGTPIGLVSVENNANFAGEPQEILYATKVNGSLMMWAKWENGCKFVPAERANQSWPTSVIRFYESHTQFDM